MASVIRGEDNFDSDLDLAGYLKDAGKSFSTSGYQKLSNGLIFQWGSRSGSGTSTLPIAFPNAALQCVATQSSSYGSWQNAGAAPSGTTGIYIYGESGITYRWFIIGY